MWHNVAESCQVFLPMCICNIYFLLYHNNSNKCSREIQRALLLSHTNTHLNASQNTFIFIYFTCVCFFLTHLAGLAWRSFFYSATFTCSVCLSMHDYGCWYTNVHICRCFVSSLRISPLHRYFVQMHFFPLPFFAFSIRKTNFSLLFVCSLVLFVCTLTCHMFLSTNCTGTFILYAWLLVCNSFFHMYKNA